ncbi:hypothetical protein KAH81_07240 [bacterium]|nr:hypothetical protein [bacterium]
MGGEFAKVIFLDPPGGDDTKSNVPIVVAGSLYLAGEALRELGFFPCENIGNAHE